MKELPPRARALLVFVHVAALGCLVWAVMFRLAPSPASAWEVASYCVLAAVAGARKLRVTSRSGVKESGSITLGFPIILAALIRGGPLVGSGAAVLSALSSGLFPRRQQSVQFFFNLSLSLVQSWLAGVTYTYLHTLVPSTDALASLAAALAAGMLYFLINSAGVMGIIAFIKGENPFRLWRQAALNGAPAHLLVAGFISATAALAYGNVAVLLLFGGPTGCLLYYSYFVTTLLAAERQKRLEKAQEDAAEIGRLNTRLQRAMTETNHRVKNNLQVVVSLMEMQLEKGQPISVEDMRGLIIHVSGLGAMHDILTQRAKDAVGETDYLSARQMVETLIPLVRRSAGVHQLQWDADDVLLPINKGTALALLMNELVSNAAKHGRGDIHLSLRASDGMGCLRVSDNGPGFPEGFNYLKSASTGLELVDNLTRIDLSGEPVFENGPNGGAQVSVRFALDTVRREQPQKVELT